MAHVLQTGVLMQDGVINAVLYFGTIATAAGSIGLLANALAVAVVGGLLRDFGATPLVKSTQVWLFPNSSIPSFGLCC